MKFELPDELKFLENRKALQHHCDIPMAGKVCVISGSTSGVGLETLKCLASRGAHLVMVCRNPEKAKKIIEEVQAIWPVPMDLFIADFCQLDQVRQAAAAIIKKYPRIDVLINSAGLHSTRYTETEQGFETVFCVNHLASFLFTYLLMGRLKESAPSRVIQVNSEGHRFNGVDPDDLNWKKRRYTGLKGYGASKTAQLLTVWEYADRLQGSGVTINAMHPGDVRTNIGNNNGWLYRFFLHHVTWHFLKDPVISGEAICYLASAPELQTVSGRFFHLTHDEKPAAHALDRAMGKRIWDISLRLTGLLPEKTDHETTANSDKSF